MKVKTWSSIFISLTFFIPFLSAFAQVFSDQPLTLTVGNRGSVAAQHIFTNSSDTVVNFSVPTKDKSLPYQSKVKGKRSKRNTSSDTSEGQVYNLDLDTQDDVVEIEGYESFQFQGSIDPANTLDY